MNFVLLLSGSALAVPVPCFAESASIPGFSLSEVPANLVFTSAMAWTVRCGSGGTVALSVTADADDSVAAEGTVDFTGTSGFVQVAPTVPLEIGASYTLHTDTAERIVVATDEAVPEPDGSPTFQFFSAVGEVGLPWTLRATITPVDYPAGLSLVGIETEAGSLLALGDNSTIEAPDADFVAGACYVPLQVFANGSILRGSAACPEVAGCSTGGGAGAEAAITIFAAALGLRRRE